MIEIRPARDGDAEAMTDVQNAIHRAGLRKTGVTVEQVRERYLGPDHRIACTVAVLDGRLVGFQSLKRAWPNNPYGVRDGWGVIGTHIDPAVGRSGIGRRLFAESLAAARDADLRHIDAHIGATNAPALAYYRAMGFTAYEDRGEAIGHRLDL